MEELFDRFKKQELILLMMELASSSPVKISLCYTLMDSDKEEVIEGNILDEIGKLKILLDTIGIIGIGQTTWEMKK